MNTSELNPEVNENDLPPYNEVAYKEIEVEPVKRGRGRPKKVIDETIVKRCRGRPKKELVITEVKEKLKCGRKKGSIKEDAICRNDDLKKAQKKKANEDYYEKRGYYINKINFLKKEYGIDIEREKYENKSVEELTLIINELKTKIVEINKAQLQEAINDITFLNLDMSIKSHRALGKVFLTDIFAKRYTNAKKNDVL